MSAALDVERFRKVQTLAREGSTSGERMAAHARIEAMAKSAGLTVLAAAKLADKASAPKPKPQSAPPTSAQTTADAFNAIFNTPEARAARAEQEAARQVKRREILARYGSADAVYADTAREALMRKACASFIVRPDPEYENYTLAGWDWMKGRDSIPPDVLRAVADALALPTTVAEAWAEFSFADALENDRQTMHDYEHFAALWVEVRRYVLADILETLPAQTFADLLAKYSWLEHECQYGAPSVKLLATLRADIEHLSKLSAPDPGSAPVQTGQAGTTVYNVNGSPTRTAAERRHAVLSILDAPETSSLSDREIARRVGVSPTTVGTLRRQMRNGFPFGGTRR